MFFITYFALLCPLICRGKGVFATPDTCRLAGVVTDAVSSSALSFATVKLYRGTRLQQGSLSDAEGGYAFAHLLPGEYGVEVSCVGYTPRRIRVILPTVGFLTVALQPVAEQLREVVVTAREQRGGTAVSVIDRTAMRHLQPTSFTDLLSLLPGGMAKTPRMGSANAIKLREVGTADSRYNTSSLGTRFLVDGAPIGTDANLQRLPETIAGQSDYARSSVTSGVDMRQIATDNIERVEIIRGIPSVKYGDLTSGVVNITRKHTVRPYELRLKADQYGQLLAVGKGWNLSSRAGVLNADVNLLRSLMDPRNALESYQRLSMSARWSNSRQWNNGKRLSWQLSLDHDRNTDQVKTDPEALRSPEDKYRSVYRRWGMSGWLRLMNTGKGWWRGLTIMQSGSFSHDRIDETRHVYLDKDRIVLPPDVTNEVTDGTFLPYNYVASRSTDGKPLYLNTRAEATFAMGSAWRQNLTVGVEWNMNKNYGQGLQYDWQRPVNVESLHRPRRFSEIPATHLVGWYGEDCLGHTFGAHTLTLTAGIRTTQFYASHTSPALQGRLYVDSRITAEWHWATPSGYTWAFSAGYGSMRKMPTQADLFPDPLYFDFVQLYYWHPRADFRRMNVCTYKVDAANKALQPAVNRKWEARLGGSGGGHEWSVSAFWERLSGGFRSSTAVSAFAFRRYDASGLPSEGLTHAPIPKELPYRTDTLLRTWNKVENGSRIVKRGVEFQYSSPRIKGIETRFTLNGAWLHTVYENSRPEWYGGIDRTVLGVPVNGKYIGLYNWHDGYDKQQFSTNLVTDTYVDRVGLLFSATVELYWWGRTRTRPQNVRPTAYMNVQGEVLPYTDASAGHLYLQWLNLSGRAAANMSSSERAYACLHLKANKQFGRYLGVALFADRLISVAPDYEVNGFVVRRHFAPYVGMEMNFTF